MELQPLGSHFGLGGLRIPEVTKFFMTQLYTTNVHITCQVSNTRNEDMAGGVNHEDRTGGVDLQQRVSDPE
jgi:hypothetical protein